MGVKPNTLDAYKGTPFIYMCVCVKGLIMIPHQDIEELLRRTNVSLEFGFVKEGVKLHEILTT